jgi:hypothetical protein
VAPDVVENLVERAKAAVLRRGQLVHEIELRSRPRNEIRNAEIFRAERLGIAAIVKKILNRRRVPGEMQPDTNGLLEFRSRLIRIDDAQALELRPQSVATSVERQLEDGRIERAGALATAKVLVVPAFRVLTAEHDVGDHFLRELAAFE